MLLPFSPPIPFSPPLSSIHQTQFTLPSTLHSRLPSLLLLPAPSYFQTQIKLLQALSFHPTSPTHRLTFRTRNNSNGLAYYVDLASKLAQDGRFQDFLLISETVLGSGVRDEKFVGSVNLELFSKGVVKFFSNEGVGRVIEVLKGVEKVGIPALGLFDASAVEAIWRELSRMVEYGRVEEVVDLKGNACW